jgi:hypothetical protein
MDAEVEWNHQPFLDYVDRWHHESGELDKTYGAVMQSCYDPETWNTTPWDDGSSGSTESPFTLDLW